MNKKQTRWEERFDERFSGEWWSGFGTSDEIDQQGINGIKSFIAAELTSLARDLVGVYGMKCCAGVLGPFGNCGRGTKTGCSGAHCKCMGKDCKNMHYVDCREHYIHVEREESVGNIHTTQEKLIKERGIEI